ncbi:MAG: hypothetical protein IJB96_08115, partial [Lachnospira sp.]|nr:hypothetical protein [Lachnospira sp.]
MKLRRRGKKVLAVVMAMLMVVGLIPMNFMPNKAEAAEKVYVLNASDAEITAIATNTALEAAVTAGTDKFFTINKSVKVETRVGKGDVYDDFGTTEFANRIKTEGKPGALDS